MEMLQTTRCILNKLTQTDYEEVKSLYSSEEVRRFLGGVVEEERYYKSFNAMINHEEQEYFWTARTKINNEFIGLLSLDRYHNGIDIELSYQLLPSFWGRGYAQEIIKRIIEFAFEELKLMSLVAETQGRNKASCRLLEKLGFKLEEKLIRFGEEQYIFKLKRRG